MTKGYGAIFDEQPRKLTPDELIVLIQMMKNPNYQDRKSSSQIANALQWTVRKTDGSISRLHGMDLIKGGKKSRIFTQEEEKIKYDPMVPEYWIGAKGEPIYKRVEHAIEKDGDLKAFFEDTEFDFQLSLYPRDGRRKTSVLGTIYNFASVDLSIHHFPLNALQQDVLLQLRSNEKLKVTIETTDE